MDTPPNSEIAARLVRAAQMGSSLAALRRQEMGSILGQAREILTAVYKVGDRFPGFWDAVDRELISEIADVDQALADVDQAAEDGFDRQDLDNKVYES